jgi:solute carrier family 40 (iron-regulated transporter), member 1
MERDWVPTLASDTSQPPLHTLNATMRRIDLISKYTHPRRAYCQSMRADLGVRILAPVFVSYVKIRTTAVMLAAVIAGLNLGTVSVEVMTAKMAWTNCAVLEKKREEVNVPTSPPSLEGSDGEHTTTRATPQKRGLGLYFSSDACLGGFDRR